VQPKTRAKKADEWRDARDGREEGNPLLELVDFYRCCPQQSTVDGRQALQHRTCRGPGGIARLRPAEPELRVELSVAGLEDPDERACRQGCTNRLYFGELAALAKRLEELGGLRLDPSIREPLRQDDGPRGHGDDDQDREDRLIDDGRFRDDVD